MASKGTKVKIAGTSVVVAVAVLGALAVYKNREPLVRKALDKAKKIIEAWI